MVIVQYKIKKKLSKVNNILSEYVDVVKKTESGTIEYKVFQDKDDDSLLIHLISFANKDAKKAHEKSEHLKKLKKILIPLSKGKAVYTTMTEINLTKSLQKANETTKDVIPSHTPI